MSRGYTGAKKLDQRENFIYIEEDVKTAIEQINKLIESQFKSLDAFMFTQFVRGHLFVLVDSLLTSNFQNKEFQKPKIESKDITHIVALCDAYCQLYCKWLNLLPNYFVAVIKK